jgi:putative phage-type endonuclease
MDWVDRLIAWLSLVENMSKPQDQKQLLDWLEEADALSEGFDLSQEIIDVILDGYEESIVFEKNDVISTEILDALCNRPQIEQRTAAWYQQATTLLTASELGGIFGSAKQRAHLIMSKVNPVSRPSKVLAMPSNEMNAMDWGVRFEPVVKDIYNFKYGTTIKELGRIINPEDNRCSASPDGLIYSDPSNLRTGRLIEIKCPVTRKPDGKIPKDYYIQIQMQLKVTGMTHCDFVEAVFDSPYGLKPREVQTRLLTPDFQGEILLIQNAEGYCRYEYGPVNQIPFTLSLKPEETLIERIPWTLTEWHEQVVAQSESWWQTTKPLMDAFWIDVERARIDPSFLEEHLKKKEKEDKCLIRLPTTADSGFFAFKLNSTSTTTSPTSPNSVNGMPCSEESATGTPL